MTASCFGTTDDKFSSLLADRVLKSSYSEIRVKNAREAWSDKLAADCTRVGEAYCRFTEGCYSSIFSDAVVAYHQYYVLTYKIKPLAEVKAKRMINDVYDILKYSDTVLADVWKNVRSRLREIRRENEMKKFAEKEAATVIDLALNRGMSDSDASATKPSHASISPAPLLSLSQNQNNNCSVTINESVGHFDEQVTSTDESQNDDVASDRFKVYANDVVLDLLSGLKYSNLSSASQKSSSSHCGSRESLSSDLMSPRSIADSRGLHQFADRLLYSLSILENGSNDSICGVGICSDAKDQKVVIPEGNRRSSAPELRTNLRKYGMKTVFEEPPRRSSVHGVRPCGPSRRKLHSSSLKSIEDNCLGRVEYSEMLTNNILCSAYIDVL